MMKRNTLLIVFLVAALAAGARTIIPLGESLGYRVMFKWGLVNKKAGTVTLTTAYDGTRHFKAQLTAKSEPWADPFYEVRDTLNGRMLRETGEPVFYEKIANEGGGHKHDILHYTRSGRHVKADAWRLEQKSAKDEPVETTHVFEADGLTVDMLSSFYYMRSLDYQDMKPGETTVLNVFSGTQKETLTIVYHGVKQIQVGEKTYPTYYITFRFTGKGGKKTSDDMEAWISTSARRIPLKMEGKLPVGSVKCYYTGQIN